MKQLFILLIYLIPTISWAQQTDSLTFDTTYFIQKEKEVEWLCVYDKVAWKTSDNVMKQKKSEIDRLGKEWFCFEDSSGTWHAVYGKYKNKTYDMVFHYVLDKKYNLKRVKNKPDTALLNCYARALVTATYQFDKIENEQNIRFNQYVKQNEDKTFTVWFLPAFQRDGSAVYGGEYIYQIDSLGKSVLQSHDYFQGQYKYLKVGKPREVTIHYKDVEKPTLGALFFVWYYKEYFTQINIACAEMTSTAITDDKKNYTWLHTFKDKNKEK